MSEQIIHRCNNCEKIFTSKSNLNVHQRTAKYCKQLQNGNLSNHTNEEESYICEYCEKECTTRPNLRVHMERCPAKRLKEKYDELQTKYIQNELKMTEKYNNLYTQLSTLQEQYNKQTEEIVCLKNSLDWEKDQNSNYKTEYKVAMKELSTLRRQLESSNENIQDTLNEKDKRIEEKDKQILYRDTQIEEYKKEKEKLYTIINEKEKELKQKEIEMKRELKKKDGNIAKAINKLANTPSSTTYIENNVISNTYTTEFNQLFQNLPNFTDTNVKERVLTLNHEGIIFSNNYDVDYNFSSKLVNVLKDLTFCTDPSRGKLIVKTEDGKQRSMSAEEFIIECIGKSGLECRKLLYTTNKYCEQQFKESRMYEDDYNNIKAKIATLIGCTYKSTISQSIKSMPTLMIKHCKQLSKRNVQQVNPLLEEPKECDI